MKKQRIVCLDTLRVVLLSIIIWYHYLVCIESYGIYFLGTIRVTSRLEFVVKCAVSLFFMLSGFTLMLSESSGTSIIKFYKKRFFRILIPYYVVTAVVLLGKLLMEGVSSFQGIPLWSVVFTILGIDGYVNEFGIKTFYTGVGEWFVGCLICMYLIFPFLKKWAKKYPVFLLGVSYVLYLLGNIYVIGQVPVHYAFFVKLFDFILGMLLSQCYIQLRDSFSKSMCVKGILLGVVLIVLGYGIHIPSMGIETVTCIVFVGILALEHVVKQKQRLCPKVCKKVANVSYEIFLVHHWIILLTVKVLLHFTIPPEIIFLCCCVEIYVAAYIVSLGTGLLSQGVSPVLK